MTRFAMKSHTQRCDERHLMAVTRHFLLQGFPPSLFSISLTWRVYREMGMRWKSVGASTSRNLTSHFLLHYTKRLSSFVRDESPSVKFNVQNIYKPLDELPPPVCIMRTIPEYKRGKKNKKNLNFIALRFLLLIPVLRIKLTRSIFHFFFFL